MVDHDRIAKAIREERDGTKILDLPRAAPVRGALDRLTVKVAEILSDSRSFDEERFFTLAGLSASPFQEAGME